MIKGIESVTQVFPERKHYIGNEPESSFTHHCTDSCVALFSTTYGALDRKSLELAAHISNCRRNLDELLAVEIPNTLVSFTSSLRPSLPSRYSTQNSSFHLSLLHPVTRHSSFLLFHNWKKRRLSLFAGYLCEVWENKWWLQVSQYFGRLASKEARKKNPSRTNFGKTDGSPEGHQNQSLSFLYRMCN